MRYVGLLMVSLCLAGCGDDIAFENPVTGATASCQAGPLADLNPWSQLDACVENREAEGWIVKR